MTIPTLIDKFDNFEIVRDQIAAILAAEVVSQKALATAGGKDPAEWDLEIYTERSNPWDKWQNDQANETPIVNVWFDNSSFDPSASNSIDRQKCEAIFNIDCYGLGVSEDVPAGGHTPGDKDAALEVQRVLRLVRNILMAGEYTYLALRGVVWRRWPQSITVFQPQIDGRTVQQIVGARLAFRVEFNEFSPEVAEEVLEIASIDIIRTEDGQIVLGTDYDYTLP